MKLKKLFPLLLIISCSTLIPGDLTKDRTPAEITSRWPQWSGDLHNNHNLTPDHPILNRKNVAQLKTKWIYETESSVIATPTFTKNTLYFNDISKINLQGLFGGGSLHAVDATTGKKIWSKKVETYTGHKLRDFSRSSPAISGDMVFIGDSINNFKFLARTLTTYAGLPGSSVMGINRLTGKLVWKTSVETHFASRITMSPIVYNGKVIVGISSQESEIPGIKGTKYPCCTFKGSIVALDALTGKLLWKTYTIDSTLKDFSGAPVWGSSPPVDVKRNRIYVGTGNNYHNPQDLLACYQLMVKLENMPPAEAIKKCATENDSLENRFDALLAMNIDTGKILWSKKTSLHDAWNVGCGSPFNSIFPPKNDKVCPNPTGLDGDFAQAPMFIPGEKNDLGIDVLAIGQKNGMFWLVDAETGKTIWKRQVGPGGKLGGHQWGSATDGKHLYYQTTNLEHKPVTMTAGLHKGKTFKSGYWGALDLKTGEDVWQTPDPSFAYPLAGEGINHLLYGLNLGRGYFASAMGPLTYYNEMLFVGSLSGEMLALDSIDGKILWSHKAKGSVIGAPSIINDTLYWGSGYHMGFEDNKVYAFGL